MNYKKACKHLGIEETGPLTKEILKKHYRMNALRYHPDKNNTPDACSKFQEIHASYDFLLKTVDGENIFNVNLENEFEEEDNNDSYAGILMSFIKNIMKNDGIQNSLYYIIIEKISNVCEKKALDMIEKVDKTVLIKIIEIIGKYREVLHFSNDFIEKIRMVLNKKIENDECIILNPSIDDLFENNLYKLVVNNTTYIVPLWHDELVYDNNGNDLYVKCFPILPENITIDNKNNIHVNITYDVKEILDKDTVIVGIGKKNCEINPKELLLMKNQTVVLKNEGISKINTVDIYDISKKSNIIVYITLE
jgi:hypothetical protein